MLTESQYLKSEAIHEQTKYNIHYDKKPLFDVVRVGMASRLLSHEYSSDLTDEQKEALNNIAIN